MTSPPDPRIAHLLSRHRWHPAEALPWLLAVGAFFIVPDYMALGTQVLVMVLFALSLDLVVGYAGIVTLGHAAFFGTGAYVVAMAYAHGGWSEPFSGLAFAAGISGAFGFLCGLVVLRYHGLTLLMMTLAIGILLREFANVHEDITNSVKP